MNEDFLLSRYHYKLPEELIAQSPATPRDSSRLLVVNSLRECVHARFRDLTTWLLPGDLLVLNNTKVIPARLYGTKKTGAPVEILLLEEQKPNCWLALVKPGKRFKQDTEIIFEPLDNNQWRENWQLTAKVVGRDEKTGGRILEFVLPPGKSLWQFLDLFGEVPLPPYINSDPLNYRDRYQTVFASELGAVAAPTAGLHFTTELLQKLQLQGVETANITLHVGVGTFRPVETDNIIDHAMHQEWIEVSAETTAKIRETKAKGGRVIAVGTTATRALEGAIKETQSQLIEPFRGKTDLFIYPGYQWQIVDGLITNFHLPGSSLLMLVSALIGRQRLLDLYREAIAQQYRFYSFGDAMLILPDAKVN